MFFIFFEAIAFIAAVVFIEAIANIGDIEAIVFIVIVAIIDLKAFSGLSYFLFHGSVAHANDVQAWTWAGDALS